MMDEVRIIAPTGTLGYGFSRADFQRCMAESQPHAIVVDAGSTDPGPYYLGAGESFTSRTEISGELEFLISEGLKSGIPVIVGSCGGAGADLHLDWTLQIVRDIAAKNNWSPKIALIDSQQSGELVSERLKAGRVRTFESETPLDLATIERATAIVAQMGPEPIIEALRLNPDIVLAGRACDEALFSALPIMHGFDRGLATHMGKILECGALASFPPAMDVMVGTIRADHFELTPGSLDRACTVASVASHSLYEREDPIHQVGPGGAINLGASRILQHAERTVRVYGTEFIAAKEYFVKLEGVECVGYRTISIAGIRCPVMVSEFDGVMEEVRRRTVNYMDEAGVDEASYTILTHAYGRDGVMGILEPDTQSGCHELGIVLEVVAETQELAHSVCHHLSGSLLHLDWPGQLSNAGNVAFPYSPSETDMGSVYVFSVYHLMELDDPLETFSIRTSELALNGGAL